MRYLLLALTLLLAACGQSTLVQPDAYADAARAGATVQAATAIVIATSEAQAENDRQATRQAARTREASEAEIARIDAELNATREAFHIRQTQEAAVAFAAAAQGTATAQVAATATTWQITATPLYATQAAIGRMVAADEARAERTEIYARIWAVTGPIIYLLIAATVCAIVWRVANRFLDNDLDRRRRQSMILDTLNGTFALPTSHGGPQPYLLAAPSGRTTAANVNTGAARAEAAPPIYVMGRRWNPETDDASSATIDLVSELMNDAIDKLGEESTSLPGWRALGWTSERWQKAVRPLKEAGIVRSDGAGTRVTTEYGDLGRIRFALETNQLTIRPAPHSDAG